MQPIAPAPQPTVTASAAPAPLVATSFALALAGGTAASATARAPRFVGSGGKSATVTLTGVTANGGTIPSGLTTSVTTTIAVPCPCSVAGPNVPPGQDTFAFNVYDGPNGTGNVIATFLATYAIAAGVANTNTVTLNGVPATARILGVPSLASGTAASTPISVVVYDADGSPITGTYAVPLTVNVNDANGALGQQLAINGGTPGQNVRLTKSGDVVQFIYGGLAESATTLGVYNATNASLGSVAVVPVNAPITYSGPVNGTTPEIDLYATSGTGSSGTLTLAQVGYASSGFTRVFTAYPTPACASIATVAAAGSTATPPPNPTGTAFTITALAAPVAGSCVVAFVNGASGQQQNVLVTYTSAQTGIQSKHRGTP